MNQDRGRAVAATAEGVYSAGEAVGAFDANLPVGAADVVVVKHLANGIKVWSKQHGTSSLDVAHGIATYTVPATPELYVTGYTLGSWGAGNAGSGDVFLARLNPANGALQWVRQFGGTALDQAFAVATSPSGAIYTAGVTLGAIPGFLSAGGSDGFLARYDAAGNQIWTRQFGTVSNDVVRGVATDANNDIYVAGHTFGPMTGPNQGLSDLFIIKFNAAGTELWRRQMGTSTAESVSGVATSRQSNGTIDVYVVGYTGASFDLQPYQGGSDAIVVKFNGLGTRIWSRQFGTQGSELAYGIASDGGANVYVAGTTTYDLVLGIPETSTNFFMTKYDSGGGFLFSRQLGSINDLDPSSQNDTSQGVAADINDSVYVTGFTQGRFTNPDTTNQGGEDYVVFRYADGCQINTPGQCGIGYGWGDPHLVTFDNRAYDFQGAGEFIFVESTVATAPFTVQARMRPWVSNNRVTVMTAVATRLGSNRVGVYLTASGHELKVDGALTSVAVGSTLPLAGGGRILRRDATSYLLSYPGQDRMLVTLNGTYLDVHFALPPSRKSKIRGLLGNFDGAIQNDFALRNGTVLTAPLSFSQLYLGASSYAASWRITQAESLFDYAAGESTATFTMPGFPASPATVADLDPAAREQARGLCINGGVQGAFFLDSCTVDVAETQDTSFIAATVRAAAQAQAQTGTTAPAPQPAGTRLYFSNFGAAVGTEWSHTAIATAPRGQRFLGPFGAQTLRLTLPATGRSGVIAMSFDVFIIGGWDGNGPLGPSTWGGLANSSSGWQNTYSNTASVQSYPVPNSPARSGAVSTDTLGYESGDSIYRFTFRFDTSGRTPIVVDFYGQGLTSTATWGLDNVEVHQE